MIYPHEHEYTLPKELPHTFERELPREREREYIHSPVRVRMGIHRLTERQADMMADIGRFRVISTRDLADRYYAGDRTSAARDITTLANLGFVQRETVPGKHWTVNTLTEDGARQVRKLHLNSGQRFYAGFAAPQDIVHDAWLYDIYRKEAQRLEADGHRLKRVVLEFELKGAYWEKLGPYKDFRGHPAYEAKRKIFADEMGLKMVNSRVVFPDLRIEYEHYSGTRSHVDLELTTPTYNSVVRRSKREAGLRIYGLKQTPKGRPERGRDAMTKLLSI